MKYLATGILAFVTTTILNTSGLAQQDQAYDYWQHQREMIRRGQQAVFMCNGLFTSNRSLEQVYEKELAFLPNPVGTPEGGDYTVNRDLRAVEVGKAGAVPAMRAVFREGCSELRASCTGATCTRTPGGAARRSTSCMKWSAHKSSSTIHISSHAR